MANIIFNCPHCNQPITEEQLKSSESNWVLIQNFLKAKENDYKQVLKQELKEEFNQQLIDKLMLKEQEMLNSFNNKTNELNQVISNKNAEINQLNANKALEIDNKILEFKNFTEQQKNELVQNYEKRINDLTQANREFKIINSKRKGENFEHEVEQELRKGFGLLDNIDKLTTGDKKADYLQTIKNNKQEVIGRIVYEVKNAEWSNGWINKLAMDVANNNTKYGILIATSFNDKYHGIPFIKSDAYENIWITDSESFVFVGQILRRMIELEYDINQKTIAFANSSNSEIIKELEAQKTKINNYWTIHFPAAYKKVLKEIDSLEKVSLSLQNNSAKINKSIDVIKQQFVNKVSNSLSAILGKLNLEEEDSEK